MAESPTHDGGKPNVKEVPNYHPPVIPNGNVNDPKSPGLHGENHGNCGTQGNR